MGSATFFKAESVCLRISFSSSRSGGLAPEFGAGTTSPARLVMTCLKFSSLERRLNTWKVSEFVNAAIAIPIKIASPFALRL